MKPSRLARRRKIRIALICLLFSACMVGLIVRLFLWQVYHNADMMVWATQQRTASKSLAASRGTIFDRNGRQLAVTVDSVSVYAVPPRVNDPDGTAISLAPLLGMKPEEIVHLLQREENFVWIKRAVDKTIGEQIHDLNLPGIALIEESKRQYPNNSLAAHVLGFTGIDNQGLDGIELNDDQYLKGIPGQLITETDPFGKPIPLTEAKRIPSIQGNDLYLTIDTTMQFIVETELVKAMTDTGCKSGTVIAMNPKSGEILAMANYPTFDPNNYDTVAAETWKNQAITRIYEPGSTFKTITTAAALQEKAVRLEDTFPDPGFIKVADRVIHDWDVQDFGNLSFVDIVKNSSNVGFVQVGMRLGGHKFFDYIQQFGFGKPTGIDLPGEEQGIVFSREDLYSVNLATTSIGQGVAVTPIQLITAVAAIANDGVLLKPQIVREVRSKDGTLITGFQPKIVRQVIDADTARQERFVLEKVVSEGGGKKAYIPGYHIGGKTGTAQKISPNGGYEPGKYVASFVGIAPIEDPQIVLLVVLDEPQGIYYGGQVATPVFKAIMQRILQYLKTDPQSSALTGAVPSSDQSVRATTHNEQIPPAGGYVRNNQVIVPNVLGRTMRAVADILEPLQLQFIPQGSGVAVRQNPLPLTPVAPGQEITVYFEERSE